MRWLDELEGKKNPVLAVAHTEWGAGKGEVSLIEFDATKATLGEYKTWQVNNPGRFRRRGAAGKVSAERSSPDVAQE